MILCDKFNATMAWKLAALFTFIIVINHLQGIECLILRDINVPMHPVAGQSVSLSCEYDLEHDELYSIKWYKNNQEFYRYLPKDFPQIQIYDLAGIKVDLENSNNKIVTLKEIGLQSSGVYRCEVSAEAPSFVTVGEEKEMIVIAIPNEGPKIIGSAAKYEINDTVNVNCTSFKSKPAAMLTWTINGNKAPKEFLQEYITSDDDFSGLETSTLQLQFNVQESHFKGGEMTLRCSATIAPIYHISREESFLGGINQLAVVMKSKSKSKKMPIKDEDDNNQAITSILSHPLLLAFVLTIALL